MEKTEPDYSDGYLSVKANHTLETRAAERIDLKKTFYLGHVTTFPQGGGYSEFPLPPDTVQIQLAISGRMLAPDEEYAYIVLKAKSAEEFFSKVAKAMQEYYAIKARYNRFWEEAVKKLPPVDAHPEDVM